MCPVGIWALGVVQFGEGACKHQVFTEIVVFLFAAVAPVDVVGLQDVGPIVYPLFKCCVLCFAAHELVARSFHVDFGTKAELCCLLVGIELEDDALALAKHAKDGAVEGVWCKFVIVHVGVAHDDAITT